MLQGFYGFRTIVGTKDPRAAHQDVGARIGKPMRVVGLHPIHLDQRIEAQIVDAFTIRSIFGKQRSMRLTTKAGIDAHHEHQIQLFQDVIEDSLGGVRIERYASLCPGLFDGLPTDRMRDGFCVTLIKSAPARRKSAT